MSRQILQSSVRNLCLLLFLSFLFPLLLLCALSAVVGGTVGAILGHIRRQRNRIESSILRTDAFPALCLIMLALLVFGCQAESPKQQPLAEVRYVSVETQRLTVTRALPGRISAFKVSEVRPQVGGIIQARLFEEGSEVTAGQVLYQIDPALYQAAYNNAKANLGRVLAEEDAARLLAERYTRLAKTNAVSVQDRDNAVAAYNRLKAEIESFREALESASINLGYTKITAPVGGRIGRSAVTEGALVTQNQEHPLARIQLISPVYVDVTQSNSQLLRLRRALASGALTHGGADSARVRLYLEDGTPYVRKNGSGQDEWIEGVLLFSDITVDESTGTVFLRAKFDNPEGVLLPGMYVRAEVIEGVLEKAVLVPQKSVGRDARNRPQIFVLTPFAGTQTGDSDMYTVEARPVTIERDYGNAWLIGSGLAPGEFLVIDGINKVRPGQQVRGVFAPGAVVRVPEWSAAPSTMAAR